MVGKFVTPNRNEREDEVKYLTIKNTIYLQEYDYEKWFDSHVIQMLLEKLEEFVVRN